MKGKVALLIDHPCEEYIKLGNTTILAQEQEDFVQELMGLQKSEQVFEQKPKDDDEVLEVNLNPASNYAQISYGAQTAVIGANYEQFGLPSFESYNSNMIDKFNILIAFKDQQHVLEDLLKQKFYHVYFIISSIKQYENEVPFPLQSSCQFKYEEINNKHKQIALIHYSNYQMRVDEIESLTQINEASYIRRNKIRLQCLWRELLTQVGKFPKYGA